ncbi:UL-16 binding protein 5 isoform X1 [Piliocolobus tephrosceles]|uniref:UL-16 binding protein 5 n=1 Tax=Piliocolobus tephrosceles TaxID=591936 RepID=A0A8C9LJE9_9PRIM|nr:UL-16 binding protein 5 isoform X1 [Piliocolobus tephrosceles]
MAAAASPAFLLRLPLLFLLSVWCGTGRADPHSLCYDITIIPKFRPGPRWCAVQGQVDKKTFLHYDCGNKTVTPVSPLGKKLNVTKAWKAQNPVLREVVDTLTQQLLDIELENYTPREPLTLQARMSCEQKAEGHNSGSWQFSFDGHVFLLFDSENRMWTTVHPGARKMKEKWENDKDVTMSFHYISMGDCTRWLKDFLTGMGSTLEPSAGAPPTVSSGATQLRATATTLILCCLLIMCLLMCPRHSPTHSHGHHPQSLEPPSHRSLLHPLWLLRRVLWSDSYQIGKGPLSGGHMTRVTLLITGDDSHSLPCPLALYTINNSAARHSGPLPVCASWR